ncbi:MAG: hypothetical protein DA329_02740 [Candidatus Nitrosocosmicus sp.]|nr:hypothetical protein [Candidatus Nitrosocosmicus sp.]
MTKSLPSQTHILNEFEINQILKNLLSRLQSIEKTNQSYSITVLPDFFVDRIIKVMDHDKFVGEIKKKIKAGGGSMRGYSSKDIKGGNAVNVAYCMAKLGVCINLYTVADEIGNSILRSVFAPFGDRVNLFIKKGKQGLSTVFEFSNPNTHSLSNVMVSDVGDNDNFGPDILESENLVSNLRSSDAIILTNWASNLRGTDLLRSIFTNSPSSIHFLDPADIEKRCFEFVNMLRINSNLVNFLSINENEFNQIVEALRSIFAKKTSKKENDDLVDKPAEINDGLDKLKHNFIASNLHVFSDGVYPKNIGSICESVKILSSYFNLTVCLHTTKGSILSSPSSDVCAHDVGSKSMNNSADQNVFFAAALNPSRIDLVSGAGDSWDAGFMFGQLYGFNAIEKLCFANLLASLHIENLLKDDPSLAQVIAHIESI